MKLLFATNNAHKIREVQDILSAYIGILSLEDIDCHEDIPETQPTIEGNATQKSTYIYAKYGIDCFADDTGLEIVALNGRPGVFSARYAGPDCIPENNMDKVLEELQGESNRQAQFRTVISLIINNEEHQFEGIVRGSILETKCGTTGFGYDPIFQPDGYSLSFAQMSLCEKNKISHRGLAVQKLASFLLSKLV